MTYSAPRALLSLLLTALFLSGIASVANQVIWQRGLKVFLGGSETLSSMIVVLVFMLGLGLGAGIMGRWAGRFDHPMRVLALVELALCLVNISIAILLSLDLGPTLFAAQRLFLVVGVPLRVFYVIGAILILLPPTLLMGATLPLASESLQRQLGATQNSLIVVLFLLNSTGAAVGAFGSSFISLPLFGQWITLLSAAGINAMAALVLWIAARGLPAATPTEAFRTGGEPVDLESEAQGRVVASTSRPFVRFHEGLGFILGALSLGYEMYLFRLMPLVYKPLPTTFATTLCLYLLFWSFGVFLASFTRARLWPFMLAVAGIIAAMPMIYAHDRFDAKFSIYIGGLLYFLPCIGFGLLYGTLVSRNARSWGEDVGRFALFNTIGSCLGTVSFTLVGYELPHDWNAWLIAIGLLATAAVVLPREVTPVRVATSKLGFGTAIGLGLLMCVMIYAGWNTRWTQEPGGRTYWGRDGVVELRSVRGVYLDGFWHSHLSNGKNHIGDPYTWMMAVAASLAHDDTAIDRALVVGNGVGLTASTLARHPGVEVVAYEINHTLRDLIDDFPERTLGVARNPNVDIRWRDARTALSLDESRYDLIVSAPLYLRQAGSSLLLSREYLELLGSRLEDGGVIAIYAREGPPVQSMLVYQTIREVFPHVVRVHNGQIALASRTPIKLNRERLASRLKRRDQFHFEIARFEERMDTTKTKFWDLLDPQPVTKLAGWPTITDDHPLVEYPWVIERLIPDGASRADAVTR